MLNTEILEIPMRKALISKEIQIQNAATRNTPTRLRSGTSPSPWSPTLNVPRTTLCEICPIRFREAPALVSFTANHKNTSVTNN